MTEKLIRIIVDQYFFW